MLLDTLTAILSAPRLEWAPTLTLLFLLGFPPCSQYMPAGSWAELLGRTHRVLCAIGLLIEPWGHAPMFWLALVTIQFAWIRAAYFIADNHHYLEGYWCIAIAIALYSTDRERWLELDATLLIGLCFALAVVMKLVNPEYRDGSFFTHLLLFDPRFLPLAVGAGGITPSDRRGHQAARRRLIRGDSVSETLDVSARVRSAARVLTWWTVGIESLIAVLFLVPVETLEITRAVLLSLFALSTFAMVAVPTFGHILLIMLAVSVDDVGVRTGVLMLAGSLSLLSFLPTAVWRRVHAYYTSEARSLGRLELEASPSSRVTVSN